MLYKNNNISERCNDNTASYRHAFSLDNIPITIIKGNLRYTKYLQIVLYID